MIWISFILAIICFSSFTWSILFFFVKPQSPRMRLISSFGTVFVLVQGYFLMKENTFSASMAVAWILYILSLICFWASIYSNRLAPLPLAFSGDKPKKIIITGPYRYVRHPFYLSYILFWTAGFIASQEPLLIITVLIMTSLYWTAAREEELILLRDIFGEEYQIYKRKTGFFFPKLIYAVVIPAKAGSLPAQG